MIAKNNIKIPSDEQLAVIAKCIKENIPEHMEWDVSLSISVQPNVFDSIDEHYFFRYNPEAESSDFKVGEAVILDISGLKIKYEKSNFDKQA